MSEEWRDIEGFDGYQISSLGRVKKGDYLMNQRLCTKGYPTVSLYKERKSYSFQVHRLVANAFIPNPDNLLTVNHINEDKTDNRVENLEWMSNQDNVRYSQAKTVNQFTLDGKFIRRWDAIMDIERELGFCSAFICRCLKGRCKSAYKYIWKYALD